jgi:hypothetical protein
LGTWPRPKRSVQNQKKKVKCRNGKSGFYCIDIFNSNYTIRSAGTYVNKEKAFNSVKKYNSVS